MRVLNRFSLYWIAFLLAGALAGGMASCGKKKTPYDENLLKNSSFEIVKDGIPLHWRLKPFRGIEGQQEVEYAIDTDNYVDGKNSWRFRGDPGTRKWYVLAQEVEVHDITHVRLRGYMQIDGVRRLRNQHAMCNFLLTFYDENHRRFYELRFSDKRTRLKVGTNPWFEENNVFRVPQGTRYIEVSCILGCNGTVWFDNVQLSVPEPLNWQSRSTENFTFYWLPDRPFPTGAIDNQQRMFDHYADLLGVRTDDIKIGYYLYPDTATIRKILSLKGYYYISWDDQEIHTINPNDDHEIIHFMTDPYGVPPRAIAEGTVFWLHGNWYDKPIHQLAAYNMSNGNLPSIDALVNYGKFVSIDANYSIPAAASFVGYIIQRFGMEKFIDFHKVVNGANSYASFTQAFEREYGVPCEQVESEWHDMLSKVKVEFEEPSEPQP
jgi:hypothetical protein